MQKDIHFYLTYALARQVRIAPTEAKIIAWANQYTDDNTEPDVYGIQTQASLAGNWSDRHIQATVIIPFHFVPGDNQGHPWMTTRNSSRMRDLVYMALDTGNPFEFGIALHALQDSFSHENFSGWQEKLNSCLDWYYAESALPNLGHAEMRVVPDVVNYIWTDPRNGRMIDNKERALCAAEVTLEFLDQHNDTQWSHIRDKLKEIFVLDSYDKRKNALLWHEDIRYNDIRQNLEGKYKKDFMQAARNHLARVMNLIRDIK